MYLFSSFEFDEKKWFLFFVQIVNKSQYSYVRKIQFWEEKTRLFRILSSLLCISYTNNSAKRRVIYNIDKAKDICYPKYNPSLPYATDGNHVGPAAINNLSGYVLRIPIWQRLTGASGRMEHLPSEGGSQIEKNIV